MDNSKILDKHVRILMGRKLDHRSFELALNIGTTSAFLAGSGNVCSANILLMMLHKVGAIALLLALMALGGMPSYPVALVGSSPLRILDTSETDVGLNYVIMLFTPHFISSTTLSLWLYID